MKKYVSLVLAALLLLGTIAFAETYQTTFVASDPVSYSTDNTTSQTAFTDVYLQVVAQGQIDVTVPLNLLFVTNIDGGEAQEPAYYIQNNGHTDLKITALKATAKSGKMTIASAIQDTDYDKYTLKLNEYDVSGNNYDGSWTVKKVKTGSTDNKLEITAEMKTSPLSFVTDTTNKNLCILCIEYTFALDYTGETGVEELPTSHADAH